MLVAFQIQFRIIARTSTNEQINIGHIMLYKVQPPKAEQFRTKEMKQVFQVKKNLWGCCPNSKYLLPSVAALSLTISKHYIVSYTSFATVQNAWARL